MVYALAKRTKIQAPVYSGEAITTNDQSILESSGEIEPSQVLVEVENGTVILSGTVKSYAAEKEAYEATIQQPGVKNAVNNLSVAIPKDLKYQ